MEQIKLNELCEINIGKTPSRNKDTYWGDGVKWLSIRDLSMKRINSTKEQITLQAIEECNMRIVPRNTVVMSFKLSIGKTAILEENMYTNEAIANFPIKDKTKLIAPYLCYALQTLNFDKNLDRAVMGATLNKAKLNGLYIPYCGITIQQRIVAVLDNAQELIVKRKVQIEALDELIKSIFYDMFGDLKLNNRNYASMKLSKICTKITDGTHNSPENTNHGIHYVTAKHLGKDGIDFYSKPTYISLQEHQTIFKRCNPVKGDVLYIKDGATTGIAAINKFDFEFSMLSSLALFKLDKELINNYFLVKYLNHASIKENILNDMVGGAIKRLTLVRINNIKVVVPPIELQNKFAAIVENIEKQKELLQQSVAELENNFNSLMQKAFKRELFN